MPQETNSSTPNSSNNESSTQKDQETIDTLIHELIGKIQDYLFLANEDDSDIFNEGLIYSPKKTFINNGLTPPYISEYKDRDYYKNPKFIDFKNHSYARMGLNKSVEIPGRKEIEADAVEAVKTAKAARPLYNHLDTTDLMAAAHYGSKDCAVEILNNNPEEINKSRGTTNERGATPLMCASANGKHEMVKFLLNKNANLNEISKSIGCYYPGYETSISALNLACKYGHTKVLQTIKEEAGEQKISVDHFTRAVLTAIYYEEDEALEELLTYPAAGIVQPSSGNGLTEMDFFIQETVEDDEYLEHVEDDEYFEHVEPANGREQYDVDILELSILFACNAIIHQTTEINQNRLGQTIADQQEIFVPAEIIGGGLISEAQHPEFQ